MPTPTVAPGATAEGARADTPEAAVDQFLSAMLKGEDATIRSLLTPLARQKGEEHGIPFDPPASETARFKVMKIDTQGDRAAYVYTTLTDTDEDGREESAEIVWVAARTPEGWRIAGAAVALYDGQEKTIINFEDPEAAQQAIADAEAAEMRRQRTAATPDAPVR